MPELGDQTFLFYGAGEAGVGIGELVAMCLEKRFGLTHEEAMRRCFFMDSKGLVTAARLVKEVRPCRSAGRANAFLLVAEVQVEVHPLRNDGAHGRARGAKDAARLL